MPKYDIGSKVAYRHEDGRRVVGHVVDYSPHSDHYTIRLPEELVTVDSENITAVPKYNVGDKLKYRSSVGFIIPCTVIAVHEHGKFGRKYEVRLEGNRWQNIPMHLCEEDIVDTPSENPVPPVGSRVFYHDFSHAESAWSGRLGTVVGLAVGGVHVQFDGEKDTWNLETAKVHLVDDAYGLFANNDALKLANKEIVVLRDALNSANTEANTLRRCVDRIHRLTHEALGLDDD